MSSKKDKGKKILRKCNPLETWQLLDLLGQGTFGIVHLVTNKQNDIHAAKICQIDDQDVFNDTKLELEILSTCSHDNVLKAFDSYYWDKKIWMILEYCSGGALDEVTEAVEGLDEVTARAVLYQSFCGLDYLHQHCIMHRDIKAGNIMLSDKGICKLADFGVSAMMQKPEDLRNTFIGTPYWMAPEVIYTQTQPQAKYDSRCDVYSMGITAIELVQVQPPDDDFAPVQVMMYRIKSESPTFEHPGNWSAAFNEFIKYALSKNPHQRPTAKACLDMNFFKDPACKSLDPVVELFKIYKELTTGATNEEVIEEEQKSEDFSDFDIDMPSPNIPAVSVNEPPPKANKTIRKTIKYEVNGVSKSKTFTKTINKDVQNKREQFKSMRDKIVHQMRALRLEEQREQAKIEASHKSQMQEMMQKQKTEMESLMDKYKTECENLNKNIMKEVEKKKNSSKSEIEKHIKKLKVNVDKERKNKNSALKAKNKNKVDPQLLEEDYIPNIQKTCVESTEAMIETLSKQLCELYLELVNDKNKNLVESLKHIVATRLLQVLAVSQAQRTHICTKLEAILQQRIKSNQKEIAVTMKYMNNKREDLVREHMRVKRELPKNQKNTLKSELQTYKSSIRKQKLKNEKELLKEKQNEISERLSNEAEALFEKQTREMENYDRANEVELKEIQEYQDQKNELTIRSYQDEFHNRYLLDDQEFKNELLKLYNLKQARDAEYDNDIQSASNCSLDFNTKISIQIF